ncbi:MAG TPA: zinc-binding dehydrogenase, partial [Acidimicrobiales bacterium]|nr:zinc-binding dehydrogenase [Acidimicrobiales bacterium]
TMRDDVAALVPGGGVRVIDPADFVGAGPYDAILELIGGPNMPGNLEALALGGRIVVIGVGAGPVAEVNLLQLMGKRGRISASTLRTRPLEGKAAAAQAVEHHVVPLLATGRVRVPVTDAFPLDQVAAAYERFAAGGKLGKVVLVL